MNIESNRTPQNTPSTFCRAELVETQDATVVRPSIPQDHLEPNRMRQAQSAIDHTDYMSRQNVKLLKENVAMKRAIGLELHKRGLTEAVYSRDELALAVAVTLETDALENTRFKLDS